MASVKTLGSGIRDNRDRSSVGKFLEDAIQPGARLSVVSAYFTIYAFHELRSKLLGIEHMRFLVNRGFCVPWTLKKPMRRRSTLRIRV